jgi:hypothetical protein
MIDGINLQVNVGSRNIVLLRYYGHSPSFDYDTGEGWSMCMENLHCLHGHTLEIYGITKEANECLSLWSLPSLNGDLSSCKFSV